ncbi:MAG: putative AAA+ superfamily ATPase [Spirosomataceae bacterium]|jgi:predicted AAA+ superfamily ATPase
MINRIVEIALKNNIDFEKAIVLKGARQVGKTTLISKLLRNKKEVLWVDGDDPTTRNLWSNISKETLKIFIEPFDYIVIDEAQRIENIGLAVKMIVDMKLQKQVIVSGSSSINLASSVNEALTGRKWNVELFPLSWQEIAAQYGLFEALKRLDNLLIYGNYPEIVEAKDRQTERLKELASSYLYQDILEYGDIRKPELLVKLLRAIAYQVGNEVSYNELANTLQTDNETIRRYIDLLEDSYVIFRLPPLSTNPRKEISTSRKIYFFDNGIRNALLNDFKPMEVRNDKGAIWENFIVSEIYKKNRYASLTDRNELFFWRSKAKSEIDLILKKVDIIEAIEIKYSSRKKGSFPPSFIERYQPFKTSTLNRDNFYEYL